jgi:hypothetical protein
LTTSLSTLDTADIHILLKIQQLCRHLRLARQLRFHLRANGMLKISIVDRERRRWLVLEGKLVTPWTNELKTIAQTAGDDRDHHGLSVDMRGVTAISADGEAVLLALMDQGARFRVSGVFMKQVLKHITRRWRRNERG